MDDVLFSDYSERFRDQSLEREYRNAVFTNDRKQAKLLLLISTILIVAMVINNVFSSDIYDGSVINPWVILTIEAMGGFILLLVIFLMNKTEDFAVVDIGFLVLMLFFTVLILYDNFLRPADFMGSFSLCIYIIYYAFIPIPTRFQLPPCLLLTIGLSFIMLVLKEPNYPSQVSIFILTSVFLNFSCHVLAVNLGRSKRNSFVATLREKRAEKELIKTREELKILSGS